MTYSIVARDPATGDLGVAVQSHWFAAGIVCWAESGVGAVATQASALVDHGPLALDLMREGKDAAEALGIRMAGDDEREHRQVATLDVKGEVAVYTGERCIPEAGHRVGDGYSCQANMMRRDTVWDAMAVAFETTSGDLADRFLAALEAAEAEGGDIRGRQAARILVVRGTRTGKPWEDVLVDLRVDDHPDPLPELARLLRLKRAYDHEERADELSQAGDVEAAAAESEAAFALVPGNPELSFWTAVRMATQHDMVEKARLILRFALRDDPGWEELLRRLAERRLSGVTPELAERLLADDAG
jgi:uncharacterized Ntn-hydrolase superfamily protein